MAAVWFTRAIRKIVKVSLEEKGMVVVMKKENRAGRFCVAVLLAALLTTQAVPLQAFAWERQEGTVSVENEYLKVTVNRANGGYAITTREGDITKKTDNDKALLHSGEAYDSSFTTFQVGGDKGEEFIFGNHYLFSEPVRTTADGDGITSTYSVGSLLVTQRIELVNNASSEQLGTAQILYTVENLSDKEQAVKSRLLMDTMLGEQDYGLYEAGNGYLGDGFQGYVTETMLDGGEEGSRIPADYFVQNSMAESTIAAFGVNSTLKTEKPYRMIFAHWANLASTPFDYAPDSGLNFTNSFNEWKTADSAVALYYDLGILAAGEKKTFSTYYGVTANVKNEKNQVKLQTTAPAVLTLNEERNAYIGSSGKADNLVKINTTVTNPSAGLNKEQGVTYEKLRVAVYAVGLTTLRQADDGNWTSYDNKNPLVTEIENFAPGKSVPTYFDFRFTPQEEPQLGSFVTKVYNFDPTVNELGVYAEDFCIATTRNTIFIPGKDPDMPVMAVLGMEPEILYNQGGRYLTIAGRGMSFLAHGGFRGLSLVKEGEETVQYLVDPSSCTISEEGGSASFYLEEYMEPGRYQVHLLWDSAASNRPEGIPEDMTGENLCVVMTQEESYRRDTYGVLAVTRTAPKEYGLQAFLNEEAFSQYEEELKAEGKEGDLLLSLRGDLIKEEDGQYRLAGQEKSVTINNTLKYTGSALEVTQENGSVRVAMDGELTTLGANTTVRNGRSHITLTKGKEMVVPVYNQKGEVISGDTLSTGEEYLEVGWDSSYSFLQSVGGFLIDLRYGVFGRMNDTEELSEDVTAPYYDIVSFGGGLDLSFMTPGGAAKARENQDKSSSWTYTKMDSTSGLDPLGDQSFIAENAPEQEDVTAIEGGAQIQDVLFGQNGKKEGYLGINMETWLTLPQIVSFLPSSMSGRLSVNTIGGYEVGVEGEAQASNFEMQFALVVKSNPSGAPIPDKLYFTLGGFEPGVNVDGMGILWLTGGGGGFDKLYDTIYGTDGLPPLTLLLNVQFDIFKVMTGKADLELSLRAIAVSLSDVSLKFVRNARFLDGGSVGVAWYPNMELSLEGRVNFLQLFKGSFYVIGTQDVFEMMMRVAISLPEYLPVVGGMEIASAELGGGTVKMWGSVTVLSLIHLGFVYYWDSGEVKFTTSRASNALQVYHMLTEPLPVRYDEKTDETQMLYLGSNLSFVGKSGEDLSLTDREIQNLFLTEGREETAVQSGKEGQNSLAKERRQNIRSAQIGSTGSVSVRSDTMIHNHLITLEQGKTYLVTVNAVEEGVTLKKEDLTLVKGDSENLIRFYEPTGDTLTDQRLTQTSNANLVDGIAYIALEGSTEPYLLTTGTESMPIATSVGLIQANPLPSVKNVTARVSQAAGNAGIGSGESTSAEAAGSGSSQSASNGSIVINWEASDITKDTRLRFSLSEKKDLTSSLAAGNVLLPDTITQQAAIEAGRAVLTLPESIPAGSYYVNVTLEEEGRTYERVQSEETIMIQNPKAPGAPEAVTLENAGNYKLALNIRDDFSDPYLEGYYVDVYETLPEGGESLKESGLFFTKEQAEKKEALIGGRYQVPGYTFQEDGSLQADGTAKELGYTPGASYRVEVRAGNTKEEPAGSGEMVLYCSDRKESGSVILAQPALPKITFAVNGSTQTMESMANGIEGLMTGKAVSEVRITSDIPVKGTLTVDGGEGSSYAFDTFSTEFTQKLELSEGIHVLEFRCENQQQDGRLVTQNLIVDTAPPLLLVESPLAGQAVEGNRLKLQAVVEKGMRYTFLVDGEQIGAKDQNLDERVVDGQLKTVLAIPEDDHNWNRTLTILAKDPAGNETRKEISFQNGALLQKITEKLQYVELYADGRAVKNGIIDLTKENSASLKLMGILSDGTMLDLTEDEHTTLEMLWGDAARLEEEKTAVQTFATMTDEAILGDGLRRIQEKNILMKNNFPVQQAASLLTENSQVLQGMTPLATTNDHFLQRESELSGSSGILLKKTGDGISQLTAVFSPVQSSNVKFMTAASVITAREEGDSTEPSDPVTPTEPEAPTDPSKPENPSAPSQTDSSEEAASRESTEENGAGDNAGEDGAEFTDSKKGHSPKTGEMLAFLIGTILAICCITILCRLMLQKKNRE